MKKGEIAIFTIPAELTYKEVGSPPHVPPKATIEFEVELLSWTSSVFVDELHKKYHLAIKSIVKVWFGKGITTGFLICAKPGLFVTISHDFASFGNNPPKRARVDFVDGAFLYADVYHWSNLDDYLILICDPVYIGDRPVLRFASAEKRLHELQVVWTISHPHSRFWRVSKGRINALFQNDNGRYNARMKCFEHDINISPGSSGAPILDESGEVVGLQTSELSFTHQAMCMPWVDMGNDVSRLLDRFENVELTKIKIPTHMKQATHVSFLHEVMRSNLRIFQSNLSSLNDFLSACAEAYPDPVDLIEDDDGNDDDFIY